MPHGLEDRVTLVTGGGRGIGRAIAEQFAREGATVVVVARTPDELHAATASIRAGGGKAFSYVADVADPDEARRVAEAADREVGPISILVNNAGGNGPFGPIWEVDLTEWWKTLEVHVRGALVLSSCLVPPMASRGGGRIINIASGVARAVTPHFSAYGIAKAALVRLTEELGQTARAKGVVAFAVDPGLIITELAEEAIRSPDAQRWCPAFVNRLKAEKQANRIGESMSKVTRLCVELASGRADALSGRLLSVSSDITQLVEQARGRTL